MRGDKDEICGPVMAMFGRLLCLIIFAVALFFAMNFGNWLSIPGVITLLILGLVAIASLWNLLSEAKLKITEFLVELKYQLKEKKKLEVENEKLEGKNGKLEEEKERLKKKFQKQISDNEKKKEKSNKGFWSQLFGY